MSRQNRRVAERLVEPGCDLGQKLDRRSRPRRSARDGRSPGDGRRRGRGWLSSKLGSSKPIENVRTFRAGSTSQRAAATLEESMPPERKTPIGTSERRCRATESRSSLQNRPAACFEVELGGARARRIPVSPDPERACFPAEGMSAGKLAQRLPDRVRARGRIRRRGSGPGSRGRALGRCRDGPGPPWARSRRPARRRASSA